jgi:hypothetical protein
LRRAALIALALAACKTPDPPGGFGVNVTVDGTQLSDAARNSIASAKLSVTGDNPNPYSITLDAVSALHSGTVHFRYDPSVHMGTLDFTVDTYDAGNALVASGDSGGVVLVDGQTATANITLTGPSGQPDLSASVDMNSVDLAGLDLTVGPDLFMPQPNGATCTADTDCKNGHCADGVCCDTACNDACHACNLTPKGTCTAVASGTMPSTGHPSCGPDPMSGCMRDGTCNGSGACRLWIGGTVCGAAACNSTTNAVTAQSTCDGTGHCVAGATTTCAPYVCQTATACYASCTGTNTGCAAGKTCNAGSCGLKSNGATCSTNAECSSTFCADGVCCNSACTQACYSCNQSATLGQCKVAPANTDPHNNCPAGTGTNSVCAPGQCNGAGACNQASAGTVCSNPSCANGTLTAQGTCSGAVCNPGATSSCGQYVCASSIACNTSCSTPNDCILGDVCNASSCQNCQVTGAAPTVYVDSASGTDDTLHGGGAGKCAVRSVHYGLTRGPNVCVQPGSGYTTEPYPLPIAPGQTLNCNCQGLGLAVLGNGSNEAIDINGSNAQLLNCDISVSPTSGANCVSVIPTGLTGLNIIGNKIHDCSLGVAVNGAGATINNNTFQGNYANGLNGLGTDQVNNNTFYCNGGGDAINGCQGTSVIGSGNYCSGCTIGCNGCGGNPNCYQSTQMFWIAASTCM